MGTGTLVHYLGAMNLSPMISTIWLSNQVAEFVRSLGINFNCGIWDEMGRHKLVILEMTFMKHWGTILNFVHFAFICLIICVAVWMLSGDIQNWMKLVIYAITFAIPFLLIRYIKKNKSEKTWGVILSAHGLCITSQCADRAGRHGNLVGNHRGQVHFIPVPMTLWFLGK